ncbi:MAG: ribonuclease domain-containing protein [Eubacteriales bacterium]|nr:ribonuclease domain-containing protein [Eubacteriales bacterium]
MKKLKVFLTAFLLLFVLVFTGCESKNAEPTIDDKEIFEEDLRPLDEDELAAMDDITEDDEMTAVDEEELDQLGEDQGDSDSSGDDSSEDSGETSGGIKVEEDGTYTSKEEVAVYIHTYGHLPSNYITKEEAQDLGWDSKEGNLDEVAPGKSIGGDTYGNYEGMLPVEEGRTYQECDIDYDGGYRNEKRLIFSNDGLIFYTGDHYETFEQVY